MHMSIARFSGVIQERLGKKGNEHNHTGSFCCVSPSPVVILFAVNAAVLGETRELGLQRQFALAALETAQVPLLIHS